MGRGNTRLIAWEGEKTLTFTVEDALLSPMGFSILSGAGLIHAEGGTAGKEIHVHSTTRALVDDKGIDLTNALLPKEKICSTAPIYAVVTESDGSLTGKIIPNDQITVSDDGKKLEISEGADYIGKNVFVDYYVTRTTADTFEMQIDAERFAGNYYVEADTLFRRKADGKDLPATLTFPNVKIQSNFTFSMASTGDPSTFTFTMDK